MIRIEVDRKIPDSCNDCPMQTEPCGNCGLAEFVYGDTFPSSTYPFCNQRRYWDDKDKHEFMFLDDDELRPDWCPLKIPEEPKKTKGDADNASGQ